MSPLALDTGLRALFDELARARGKLAGRASLAVVERTISRCEMAPLHVHEEPEGFHVLEGSLLLVMGSTTVRLEPGQSLVAPAGVPHTYRAESESTRYQAVSFVASVELYEGFLRAAALPEPEERGSHESDRVVESIAGRNGISILGPPGALPAPPLAA
jgi:mannose-6-phosphate isomerase-like protein (cupin superfamily)